MCPNPSLSPSPSCPLPLFGAAPRAVRRVQNYQPPSGYVPTMTTSFPEGVYGPGNETLGLNRAIVPFIACGSLDGYDADQSYPLVLPSEVTDAAVEGAGPGSAPGSGVVDAPSTEAGGAGASGAGSSSAASVATGVVYQYTAPVQSPINPPYAEYLAMRRAKAAGV
jgi:hypothetical protein